MSTIELTPNLMHHISDMCIIHNDGGDLAEYLEYFIEDEEDHELMGYIGQVLGTDAEGVRVLWRTDPSEVTARLDRVMTIARWEEEMSA